MWEHYNDTVCVITPIFRTNTLNSKTNALTLHSRSQHTPVAVPGSPLFCHCISSSQCVPILHREEHTSSVTFCVHVRCYSTILLLFLFLFCSHFFLSGCISQKYHCSKNNRGSKGNLPCLNKKGGCHT